MPAIADQVATIEHDLAVAQTTCDSLRSENAQLKNALAALNVDHNALQAKHIDALALVDETRQHADGVATAALAMLKVSRRQIVAEPSGGTKALQAMTLAPAVQEETDAAIAAAIEPEKTDVRPELPEAEFVDGTNYSTVDEELPGQVVQSNAWQTDIIPMTGPITPIGDVEIPNTDRLRAHMPGEEPLPIFLKPRAVPDANVLG